MGSAEVAVPRKFENISTLQSRLWTANESALLERNLQPYLERYVMPDSQVGSIDSRSGFVLPVVDLAGLHTGDPSAREEIVRQIGNAAGKWGFFQVVNHGISEETVDTVEQQTRHFFQLPVDVKERAEIPDRGVLFGYNGRLEHKPTEAPWLEFFAQGYHPKSELEATAEKVWPGGNATFCNAVHGWCQEADRLGQLLMLLLAESLGLEPDTFSKEFEDPANYKSSWRLHHYPACPDPARILGAKPHSDTGAITILKQDAVGGLQFRDGDKFFDIAPVRGAMVVNIGDTLEVWSNGRFRSSEHRVVVNEQSDRYSIVYLIHGPVSPDFVVQCPPELVDDAHPCLYIPYTYADYRANYESLVARGLVGRSSTLAFALRKDREGQHDKE